jgi:transcriptional antiterminator NusG
VTGKSHWYVIRAKSKKEHDARDEMRALGVDVYLPERKVEAYNRRRRVTVISTLTIFPGYLFAQLSTAAIGKALKCKAVADILPGLPHDPVRLSAADVQLVLDLRDAQERLLLDDTQEARRKRGETKSNTLQAMRKRMKNRRVRVTDGPFASFPGVVESVETLERVRVLIEIFGRPTSVELEVGQFAPLAPESKAA